MKTIRVNKDIKKRLDLFPEAKSINKTMRMLVEDAEKFEQYTPKKRDNQTININMDDDVFDKFLKCKKYPNESHSDTIERLLDEFELSDE